jgi:FAD/FMN-containing dehydrogenase
MGCVRLQIWSHPECSCRRAAMDSFESWGRYPRTKQKVDQLFWPSDFPVNDTSNSSQLPVGEGRSYGDVCLNDKNVVLLARGLNRLLAFDSQTGILRCESGVTLAEILDLFVPRGWFLPVTPGTKFVTVGGAIANDVHGKNHHLAGTFGRHVLRFGLSRSDGTQMECSPAQNAELYSATIGGLGLTGLISWAEIQLKAIVSRKIKYQGVQFNGLEEFMALSEANSHCEYTVSWLDSTARGDDALRGIFMIGDHDGNLEPRNGSSGAKFTVPIDLPSFALNRSTVGAFNTLYFHKQFRKRVATLVDYEPFFYPLDVALHWNRMYGKDGLLQFQCVVPTSGGLQAITEMLTTSAKSGLASFLTVLKIFGNVQSPGMMSFPVPGITLTLDFPIRSDRSFSLVDRLGEITLAAKGRIYPAKDARMTASQFQSFYPQYRAFSRYIDPKFSSSFWRRVNGE